MIHAVISVKVHVQCFLSFWSLGLCMFKSQNVWTWSHMRWYQYIDADTQRAAGRKWSTTRRKWIFTPVIWAPLIKSIHVVKECQCFENLYCNNNNSNSTCLQAANTQCCWNVAPALNIATALANLMPSLYNLILINVIWSLGYASWPNNIDRIIFTRPQIGSLSQTHCPPNKSTYC